jgi:lysophospholipase L1-like esterase
LEAACAAVRRDHEGTMAALARTRSADGERRDLEAYNDRLRQMTAQRQLDLVDLARIFASRGPATLLSDVVHPTASGHRVVADELAKWIARPRGDAVMGR